jgi:hypothetical protein
MTSAFDPRGEGGSFNVRNNVVFVEGWFRSARRIFYTACKSKNARDVLFKADF